MTKSGSDHLKRRAREIARATRRRFPDVLAELRGAPRTTPRPPSKELVLLCDGMAHPLDGGRCARTAGHRILDGNWGWGWCGWGPNDAVNVWIGYYEAERQAKQEQEEARRAALTPEERAQEDAEAEAAYRADMAENARDPYDPDEERSIEYALDAADEERWAAEAEADGFPYDEEYR